MFLGEFSIPFGSARELKKPNYCTSTIIGDGYFTYYRCGKFDDASIFNNNNNNNNNDDDDDDDFKIFL